jgi:hypothetical protein
VVVLLLLLLLSSLPSLSSSSSPHPPPARIIGLIQVLLHAWDLVFLTFTNFLLYQ